MDKKTLEGILTPNNKKFATICGSTKFFFEAMEANRQLTFMGWMVLMCGSWGHSFHKFDKSEHERDYTKVKQLHFEKIHNSSLIVAIGYDTYIGSSTSAEISYARWLGLDIVGFYPDRKEQFECIAQKNQLSSYYHKPFSDSIDRFIEEGNHLGI